MVSPMEHVSPFSSGDDDSMFSSGEDDSLFFSEGT